MGAVDEFDSTISPANVAAHKATFVVLIDVSAPASFVFSKDARSATSRQSFVGCVREAPNVSYDA